MKHARAQLLMCAPDHFRVEYVINPWMEGNVGRTSSDVAIAQWTELHRLLSERTSVEVIAPVPALPDMVFTANAGLVTDTLFIPSRFAYAERQPETIHATHWFRERDFKASVLPTQAPFEGEGDALLQRGEPILWAGYGVRTALQSYRHIAETLNVEVIPLRLIDERFYHLDTCFCPLPGGRVMYYPAAFDVTTLRTIETRVPPELRIEVGEADALGFACNAVQIQDAIIANYFSDELREQLAAWNLEAISCPLTEFMRAGGAAKCLVLRIDNAVAHHAPAIGFARCMICERRVEMRGHLIDSGLMKEAIDQITEMGGSFEVEDLKPGLRRDQESFARLKITAPSQSSLEEILTRLIQLGAQLCDSDEEVRTEVAEADGVAPADFYSTTVYPTEVRIGTEWIRATGQRMDVVLVISEEENTSGVTKPQVRCTLIRDLKRGERVVCGIEGIRTLISREENAEEEFAFMSSGVSSERRVEVVVEEIAWEMRRIRERRGKVVVVAGPVVVHTGGGAHLAQIIRDGYVHALLGGNAIAVHDLEQSIFGTSLGVDLSRGVGVQGGHRHHLRVINSVRACGSIAEAVNSGLVKSGVMYECVRAGIPFSLAGSIRDDGPLPDTEMDLIKAQAEYARLINGADMVLMLSSMLHSIGAGNMTSAGVKLICVDISPAVVTKLADRGSVESVGVVTDVGLFLNLLAQRLAIH